jgi:hypothetical protein
LIAQRAESLREQLQQPGAPVAQFDATGSTKLVEWRSEVEFGKGTLRKLTDPEGRRCLHIRIQPGRRGLASWRTTILLDRGQYRVEGLVRTTATAPMKGETEAGACLRVASRQEPVRQRVHGDSSWQKVEQDFEVAWEWDEVEVICELRGGQGEAWFEIDSLELRKL